MSSGDGGKILGLGALPQPFRAALAGTGYYELFLRILTAFAERKGGR